jgi:starvation-inducible outer membrane lipoprotein
LKGRRENDITNQIHGRLMAKKAGFVDGKPIDQRRPLFTMQGC